MRLNLDEYILFLRWLGFRIKHIDGLDVFAVGKHKIIFADEHSKAYCYAECKDGNVEFNGSDEEIVNRAKKIWENVIDDMMVV